ncbi:MAG: hypothetical protein ABSG54_05465 [Terriglobia bacterium]
MSQGLLEAAEQLEDSLYVGRQIDAKSAWPASRPHAHGVLLRLDGVAEVLQEPTLFRTSAHTCYAKELGKAMMAEVFIESA